GYSTPQALRLEGDIHIAAPGSVGIFSSEIRNTGGNSSISATYVNIASERNLPTTPETDLAGSLTVEADYMDASVISRGVSETILRSTYDMRLSNLIYADGALTLDAGQMYPSTGFEARIVSPEIVRILGGDPSLPTPLSAGGSLSFEAPVII